MWDTGAEITGIRKNVAEKLSVTLDREKIIPYRDVNGNISYTCGVAAWTFCGVTLSAHVIEGLSHTIIIGWDTITTLEGIVDSKTKTININVKNKKLSIPTLQSVNGMSTTTDQSDQITKIILKEFQDVIAIDTNKPSVTHLIQFEIDTGDHPPVCTKSRTFHPELEKRIQQRLDEMCQSGIMEKIDFSQWSSNIRPVNKPDDSIRVCGNYVALNKITTSIQYPFVNMHEALQSMGNAKFFKKVDLASGYYQIPIKPEDKEKTALVTKSGFYVFNVMSMGLKNGPMIFQHLMDKTLGVYRFVFCIAYLDDLIIYSPYLDTHIKHIKLVLERLRFPNLSINLSKCQWVLPKVECLGFLITADGIQGNPEKFKPIIEYPVPTTIKNLEQFLGMAGVYQRLSVNIN